MLKPDENSVVTNGNASINVDLFRRLVRLSKRGLLFMILLSAASGCSARMPDLDGTWILKSIDAVPTEAASEQALPFFKIEGDSIEGYDGCNQFSGSIAEPGAISSTRMACPDTTDLLPLDLNDVGKHLSTARLEGETLELPAVGEHPASTYVRGSAAKD